MDRNLDGMYFRVKRDGKYKNICFSDLTETEREKVCKDMPTEWYKVIAYHLADTLKKIGDDFDIVGK